MHWLHMLVYLRTLKIICHPQSNYYNIITLTIIIPDIYDQNEKANALQFHFIL